MQPDGVRRIPDRHQAPGRRPRPAGPASTDAGEPRGSSAVHDCFAWTASPAYNRASSSPSICTFCAVVVLMTIVVVLVILGSVTATFVRLTLDAREIFFTTLPL